MPAILAKKLGMTQLFTEDGERVAVTVIEAGPCPVTAVRDGERDGYSAVQLAFGATRESRLSKPEVGHLKKAGAPALRRLVEFRRGGDEQLSGFAAELAHNAVRGRVSLLEMAEFGLCQHLLLTHI